MNKIITLMVIGLLFASNVMAQAPIFSFNPTNLNVASGDTITVEMQAEDFVDVGGFQFLLTFDESVLEYLGPVTPNPTIPFPGLLGLQGNNVPGEGIRVSWSDLQGGVLTLNGGDLTTVLTTQFIVKGFIGDIAPLSIDCINFDCEIIGDTGVVANDVDLDEPGTITVTTGNPPPASGGLTFSFNPSNLNVASGDTITVEMQAENFIDVGGFQYLLTFDESVLEYLGPVTPNPTIPFPGLLGLQGNNVPGEGIRVSWSDLQGGVLTLNGGDLTTVLTTQFIVKGFIGDITPLAIDCINFDCEIIGDAGVIATDVDLDEPGSVTVTSGTPPPTSGDLEISSSSASGDNCEEICVDISVNNFTDMIGMQYSMTWDASVLSFTQVQNSNLQYLTTDSNIDNTNNFNTPDGLNNTLIFSWSIPDAPGTLPVSVENGTSIYQVCFTTIGDGGSTSSLVFGDDPVVREFIQEGETVAEEIEGITNNGLITVTGTGTDCNLATINVDCINGDSGEAVCIPVSMDDFTDIEGIQWSMNWDSNVMTYDSTTNHNAALLGFGPSRFNSPAPGQITMSWNTPVTPVSLTDGETLYEICFTINGDIGDASPLTISNTPSVIEVTQVGPGGSAPIMVSSNDCEVDVTDGSGFFVTVNDTEACPGDIACVPFTVNGYSEVIGFQWTIEYDTDVLTFNDSVGNIFPSLAQLGLVEGRFNEVNDGFIRFAWDNPLGQGITLPGEDVLIYEVCFDVIGNLNDISPVEITDGDNDIEVIADDMGVNTINLPVFATNGTVTVECPMTTPLTIDTNASTLEDISCNGADDGSIIVAISGGTSPYTYAWNDGTTTKDRTTLSQGTYTLTVTDADGTTASEPFTFNEPTPISSSATATNETDENAGDGTINITTPTGGTTPYTYLWSNGATTQNIADLSANTYTLTITDANDCEFTLSAEVGTDIVIDPLVIDPPSVGGSAGTTITHILCFGDATGAIDLSFSGGAAPFSFSWSNGASTEDIADLTAGTYTVTITDGNGSSASQGFDVNQPNAALTIMSNASGETIQGANDGAIDITVSGGTPDYTYDWSNGSTDEDQTALPAGDYTVVVTDDNGCTASLTATVAAGIQELSIDDNATEVNNINCFGDNNGSINLAITGGQAPFTFNWDNAPNTQNISNLSAGDYNVTVSDNSGMTATGSYTITQPASAVSIDSDTVVNETAPGTNDGSVTVNVAGGTMPYSYSWNNGGTTNTISGLTASTYTVTISDANGCTLVQSYEVITEGFTIDTNNSQVSPVNCFGEATGGINLVINGGTAPFTYAWSGGQNTQNIAGLTAGQYTVTVTDANSNTDQATFNITQPAAALNAQISFTPETTANANDGTITLMVSGGSPNYSYAWSNGATSQNLTNLAPGTYTGTITDSNGCTFEVSATINSAIPPVSIDPSATVITGADCFGGNNGSIDLEITGGQAPYTYLWNDDRMTQDINGLSAGQYLVTVTDANGISDSESFLVGQGNEIIIDINNVTPVSINGGDGEINISVSGGAGGFTYQWSGPNGFTANTLNILNLNEGTYTLLVTDANGCTATESILLTAIFGISSVDITDVLCFGESTGAIDIEISGGTAPFQYTWRDASGNTVGTFQDLNNVPAGTYTIDILDSNGATHNNSFTIEQPTSPITINNVQIVDEVVPNLGSIGITVSGGTPGYTYEWTNGATTQDINDLVAGMYGVIITDANGCILISEEFEVGYVPTTPFLSDSDVSNISCNAANGENCDGEIMVEFEGGDAPYTFNWSNGMSTNTASSSPTSSIDDLCAGNYSVTLTDNNGQTASASFMLDEPEAINADGTDVTNAPAPGEGAINLILTGGTPSYDYQWNGPNGFSSTAQDISNLEVGNYTVEVTDANGCFATFDFVVDKMDIPLNEPEPTIINVICPEDLTGAINIITSGGFGELSYLWVGPNNFTSTQQNISGLAAGEYILNVTDEGGSSYGPYPYIVNSTSNLQIGNAFQTGDETFIGTCDATASVIPSSSAGIASIVWDNGQVGDNATNLCAGIHTVTVTDNDGCQVTGSVNIVPGPPPPPAPIVLGRSNVTCTDNCDGELEVMLNGTGAGALSYEWDVPGADNFPIVFDVCPGTYNVTVTDELGRSATAEFTIENPEPLSIEFETTSPSGMMEEDGSAEAIVTGGNAPYAYQWNDDSGCTTALCENLMQSEYWVVVTDANGCVTTNSVDVSAVEGAECMMTRSIITPGDDAGLNVNFIIACAPNTENTLEIYNRWGQLVYETENYQNDWNGVNRRGNDLPEGGYFYVFTWRMADGTSQQIPGHITLLRDR